MGTVAFEVGHLATYKGKKVQLEKKRDGEKWGVRFTEGPHKVGNKSKYKWAIPTKDLVPRPIAIPEKEKGKIAREILMALQQLITSNPHCQTNSPVRQTLEKFVGSLSDREVVFPFVEWTSEPDQDSIAADEAAIWASYEEYDPDNPVLGCIIA